MAWAFLFGDFAAVPLAAEEATVVALIDDGPSAQQIEFQELFQRELVALTEGEFPVEFRRLQGDWSQQGVNAAVEEAYADPQVDMVLVTGFIANQIVSLRDSFPKPTFLPLVLDADLLDLPREGRGSGRTHLNYLSNEVDFQVNLDTFHSVVPFDRLGLLVDGAVLQAIREVGAETQQVAAELGVELVMIPYTDPSAELVDLIPEDVQAVMIDSLGRLSEPAVERLVAGLIRRRIPSFSLYGDSHVAQGILTTDTPDSDFNRLARRAALNMQAVMLGEAASDQPVDFEGKRRLFLNMATARAIDVWPRYEILVEAVVFGTDEQNGGPRWTLGDVAQEAVRGNLDLLAQRYGTDAGELDIREARASLLPQISVDVSTTQLDGSSSSVVAGQVAERSTSGSLGVSQILWSEPSRANVAIQQQVQRGRLAELERFRLDTVQLATVAFLNILRSETQLRIQRNNLELSRENLELARDRVRLGSANASDVYRWQSELANAQQNAIAARTDLLRARENLNRLLHRPLQEPFVLEPTTLDDPSLLIEQGDLDTLIDNPKAFRRMTELMVQLGLERSPELTSIRASIAAKERELASNKKAYYTPSVSLSGQLSRILEEDRRGDVSLQGDDDWSIALLASLPLFQGGARKAKVTRGELELKQLQTQAASTAEQIEQSIRSNLHLANGSFNSIPLAQNGARAAEQSLELVTDSYSQGAVSIIELLDAQSAALTADQAASNAVYNFLIDLMNAQRATGRFDFFLGLSERSDLLDQLRTYISTGSWGHEEK